MSFEYNINDTPDEAYDASEFQQELENYLPTYENTDKVKKPLPSWFFSMLISAATCIVLFIIYSTLILPFIRPSAVISYVTAPPVHEETEPQSSDISSIYEKVSPSIVAVESETAYRNFFGLSSQANQGSGIIISPNGYILTSNSLVGENTKVYLDGEKEYTATLVGTDKSQDIAIIKIDATGLVAAQLGDSDNAKPGDTMLAIGNVLGGSMGVSITKGIICGVNTGIAQTNGTTINLLQTDAATNPASSGGCLVNVNGDVIGMITDAVTSNVDNISFAIPSNDIKAVAESLISTGEAPQGVRIGITGSDSGHGVIVETVADDTPAKKAGIEVGDLILKVDGTAVKSISEINKIRDTHKKGDTLIITVYRSGEMMDIEITL